jgi:hypothetical protein
LYSYFANLASSIAVRSTSGEDTNAFDFKKYFPNFLWLLRDVHLLPTGADGAEVTPTEYLVSKVLCRGKSFRETRSDEVGRAILTFFPSIECKILQAPSSDPQVVRDMAKGQDSLDPAFNKQVDQLVQYLFQHLRAKKGFSASNLVDGPILAAMTEHYLEAVNDQNAVPCITDTWIAAVERRCQEVLQKVLQEYTQELESRISVVGLPIEEDSPVDAMKMPVSLFGIHRSILLQKTGSLLAQVGHLVSSTVLSSGTYNTESLSAELDHCTAVFEDEIAEIRGQQVKRKKVTGGILFKFAQRNYSHSRSGCLSLFEKLYQQIEKKVNAIQNYSFEEVLNDLNVLHIDYFREAVGPAKWEVYDEKREFLKAQEGSFKSLKGFQQTTFEALQKAAEESAKAAELADSVSKLQVQMRNDAELNRKRIDSMQEEHRGEMQRLRDEEAEQMKLEQQKYEDLTKAHLQEIAELSKEDHEEMKRQFDSNLQRMDAVIKQNNEEISSLNSTVDRLTATINQMGK